MVALVERFSHLPSAIESGTICAVAGQTRREIREWTALQKSWQHHFELSLRAMAGEWAWKEQKNRPTFDEYLADTDNLAFTFCFVPHWIATGTAASSSDLDEILAASQDAQRVYRLINDFCAGFHEVTEYWGAL
ncbi:hypothetical protein ACFY4C_35160 [Actinomadura viridis]|uniref:terpene synthase family protein n=1 Tax=Actinomadura viridis TaxID=58110 RepID=UPI0036C96E8F